VAALSTNIVAVKFNQRTDIAITYDDVEIIGNLGLGNNVTVIGNVRNIGDVAIESFYVNLYYYTTSPSYLLQSYLVPQLIPGEVFAFNYDWAISISAVSANIHILVDQNYEVIDDNRTNNYLSIDGNNIDAWIIPNSFVYYRELQRISVEVSTNTTSGVYLNIDFYRDGLPNYGGSFIVGYHYWISTSNTTVSFYYPNVGDGTTSIYVKLTPDEGYYDTNPSNNIESIVIRNEPDLIMVPEFVLIWSNYTLINNVSTQFQIRNQGRSNATNFSVYVFNSTQTLVGNITVDVLQPGEHLFLVASWTGPAGSQQLMFLLDPNQTTTDADQSNNFLNITRTVEPMPLVRPNGVNYVNAIKDNPTNQKNDTFQVNMDLMVDFSATYRVKAWIREPSGRSMVTEEVVDLSLGLNTINLNFSALQFGRANVNGSILVSELLILNVTTNEVITHAFNLFRSQFFNSTDFEVSPIILPQIDQAIIELLTLTDGQYRQVRIAVDVQSWIPGDYLAVGVVRLPDGGTVAIGKTYKYYYSDWGSIDVLWIDLQSEDFYNINETGPFILEEILFFNQSTLIAYSRNSAVLYIPSDSFSPEALELTGRVFELPEDDIYDSDSLFDTFNILVEAKIGWSASYYMNAKLSTLDGKVIGWAQQYGSLTAGFTNITITFQGFDIWSSLQNGPYVVSDISIYPGSDQRRVKVINSPYLTSAYSFDEFQTGAVVQGHIDLTSGINEGVVVWHSGYGSVFSQTNATGQYSLAFSSSGRYTIQVQGYRDYFIFLNGQLITIDFEIDVTIGLGEVLSVDFIEPYIVDEYTYTTIQSAINAASSGDIILVQPYGTEMTGDVIVNKSLSIEGRDIGYGTPVINAATNSVGVHITASDVILHNFRIINSPGEGVWVDAVSNVALSHLTVQDNTLGIRLTSTTNSMVFGNYLENNTQNAFDDGTNQWDSGLIGNYYSDYAGVDNNNDGLGDSPYAVSGGASTDLIPRILFEDRDFVFVDGQGMGDFLFINDAINWVQDGALIKVYPGTYYEAVVVTKSVQLVAPQGASSVTIIHYSPTGTVLKTLDIQRPSLIEDISVKGLINVNSENVTLQGINVIGSIDVLSSSHNFTFTDSNISAISRFTNAFNLYTSHNFTLQRLNIVGTRFGPQTYHVYDYGFNIRDSESGSINSINISGELYYGAFYLYRSSYNDIRYNKVNLNRTSIAVDGIRLATNSINNVIFNNTFDGVQDGIEFYYSTGNRAENNSIYRSNRGLHLYSGTNNLLLRNLVVNSTDNAIYARTSAQATLSENTFQLYPILSNGRPDVYIHPDTVLNWSINGIGNYWDTYNGPDSNNDGIGDIPFIIINETWQLEIDPYPLINPIIGTILPDTAPPTINDYLDISFLEGTTGYIITWNPIDRSPEHYEITLDGTVIESGPWTGGDIFIDLDSLSLTAGTYIFACIVYDSSNNQASDTVVVTVTTSTPDTTAPTINDHSNISFEVESIGHSITWIPDDLYPSTYEITLDGTEIESGTWTGGNIILDLDSLGLTEGIYYFICYVYDISNNQASDTVVVTVTALTPDTTAPTINDHPDLSFDEGTTGHNITWTPFDFYPSSYNVTMDGNVIASGSWTVENIVIDLDTLSLTSGTYTFVCNVNDASNNHASDIVTVTITTSSATSSPSSTTSSPSSITSSISSTKSSSSGSSPGFEFFLLLITFGLASFVIRRKRRN
jgi:parallel beta-helix repeat protein